MLELGCGTGRVLVPLARAGLDVVGLDISPKMLELAQRKVDEAGVQSRVRLVQADARSFSLGERFRLAFVALNSFMHFVADDDPARVLYGVAQHLRPDGRLILDLPNPEPTLLGEGHGQVVHEWTRRDPESGNQLLKFRSQRLDTAAQLIELTFIYDETLPDGLVRRSAIPFTLRYFYRREMELLLASCGFAVDAVYGSYQLDDHHADSLKMILVARPAGAPGGRGGPPGRGGL